MFQLTGRTGQRWLTAPPLSLQLQRGLHQADGPLPQQEDLPGEHQEAEGPERSPEKLHRRPQEEGERRQRRNLRGCLFFWGGFFKASLTPPTVPSPTAETSSRLRLRSVHGPLAASCSAGRVQPVFRPVGIQEAAVTAATGLPVSLRPGARGPRPVGHPGRLPVHLLSARWAHREEQNFCL